MIANVDAYDGYPLSIACGPSLRAVRVVNYDDFVRAGIDLERRPSVATQTWSSLVRRYVLGLQHPPQPDRETKAARQHRRELNKPFPLVFQVAPALDGHRHPSEEFGDLEVSTLERYMDIIDRAAADFSLGYALERIAASGIGPGALAVCRAVIPPAPPDAH